MARGQYKNIMQLNNKRIQ